MIIQSKLKEYEVHFETDLNFIEELLKLPNTQVVIDSNVYDYYKDYFTSVSYDQIYILKATEANKTIEEALKICEIMTKLNAKRNAHLMSFGGGIVQDLTGFVANVLYRGVRWTFVPTTLLAACDSCIGGKTSLNYKQYKNLLGTFYPPDDIYICPTFFETLTTRDFESGMGEVLKFNIMSGAEGIDYLNTHLPRLLNRYAEDVAICVKRSLEYKKSFIEVDEFDKGERIKLNFAHTFGHAIETSTNYVIPHGTAVAIGMIMANAVSFKRGLLKTDYVEKTNRLLKQVIHIDIKWLDISIEAFINAMRKDKKQTDSNLTAVLLTQGEETLKIVHDITEEEVDMALNAFKEYYMT